MNTKLQDLDLREILFIIKKHIWLMVIITIACGAVGFVVSKFFITPQYEANALLIVNPGQSSQNTITYDQVNATQELVGTYAVIMTSDTVLDQVVSDLNLDITAKQLAKKITVSGVGTTEVINVNVKNSDPQLAKDIANDIISVAPNIIIRTVKAGSVETISKAKANSNPVSPNILLNSAISLLIGLLISIILAFLLELMNNTFSSDDEVQEVLGFTVLGVIPNIDQK